MNTLKSFILLFIFCLSFSTKAQRPLPIEQVKPIIDSVKIEVNRLFNYTTLSKKSLEKINAKNKAEANYFLYQQNDSLLFLYLTNRTFVNYTFYYNYSDAKLISIDSTKKELNKKEGIIYEAKLAALKEAAKAKFEIVPIPDSKIEYVFHENNTGFTLYAFTIPTIDSLITIGGDFRFIFDRKMKLVSFKKYKRAKRLSNKRIDIPSKQSGFIGSYSLYHSSKNDFNNIVPDFYKFRRFYENLNITESSSTINKRTIFINGETNEITIELFPIEKRK